MLLSTLDRFKRTLIQSDENESPYVLFLPSGLEQDTMVPLAGFLLGYPVTYVPLAGEQSNYLSNVALDVVTLSVECPGLLSTQALLKFSCPSDLVQYAEDGISSLVDEAKETVQRVEAGSLIVHRETCILERVAM